MVFDHSEGVAGWYAAVVFGDVHALVSDVDVELSWVRLVESFALEDADGDRAVLVLVDDELSDVRVGCCVDGEDVAGVDADVAVIGFGERAKVSPGQPVVDEF